jgi:hypothetical protein
MRGGRFGIVIYIQGNIRRSIVRGREDTLPGAFIVAVGLVLERRKRVMLWEVRELPR